MNQPRRSPKINVGDCFLAPIDGSQLYYQQQTNAVVHIDAGRPLICLLEKEYIETMYQQQRPVARIPRSEFKNIAAAVFSQLGGHFHEEHVFWELPSGDH